MQPLSSGPTLDEQLRVVIAKQGLSGDPSMGRELPSLEEPLTQLGMKLFFSKALGGNLDSACVSCHHPLLHQRQHHSYRQPYLYNHLYYMLLMFLQLQKYH